MTKRALSTSAGPPSKKIALAGDHEQSTISPDQHFVQADQVSSERTLGQHGSHMREEDVLDIEDVDEEQGSTTAVEVLQPQDVDEDDDAFDIDWLPGPEDLNEHMDGSEEVVTTLLPVDPILLDHNTTLIKRSDTRLYGLVVGHVQAAQNMKSIEGRGPIAWSMLMLLKYKSVEDIFQVFRTALLIEFKLVYGQTHWKWADFISLDKLGSQQFGCYLIMSFADHFDNPEKAHGYVGSGTAVKGVVSRMTTQVRTMKKPLQDLSEKLQKSALYETNCDPRVTKYIRQVADFDADELDIHSVRELKRLTVCLEGILTTGTGTYQHPGYTHRFAPQGSYDIVESIRAGIDLGNDFSSSGLNRAWPLTQGVAFMKAPPSICSICGKSFPIPSHLERHMFVHGEERLFECPHEGCEKRFKLPEHTKKHNLNVHIKIEKSYHCTVEHCSKAFKARQQLVVHLNVAHSDDKPWPCQFDDCDKAYKTKGDLGRHTTVHSTDKPIECSFDGCSEMFKYRGPMLVHLRKHTEINRCDFEGCGKVVGGRNSLKMHRLVHTTERPHACTQCDKTFKSNRALVQHMGSHSDAKLFKCDFADCSVSYKAKAKLHIHQRDVHGTGPLPPTDGFPCTEPECGKVFPTKAQLVLHGNAHSDDRPFICNIDGCTSAFKTKSKLTRHQNGPGHPAPGSVPDTDPRPFVCNIGGCTAAFKEKKKLTRHQKEVSHSK